MENKKKWTVVLDIVTYVIVFFVLQFLVLMGCLSIHACMGGIEFCDIFDSYEKGLDGGVETAAMLVSSLLTMLLFIRVGWSPVNRSWLQTRQWDSLVWTAAAALGCILPLEWAYERMQLTVPEDFQALFNGIMSEPLGYMAVGLLVPLAEELVFRGAVLRVLLGVCSRRRHWVAIVISALVFAVVHGNLAQGAHAFILGLLLGWLYYRSGSIVPGVVVHWVNNTTAFVLFKLMPEMGDGQLIDFFHGSNAVLCLGLLCSLCIVGPSLYQLHRRLHRA